MTDGMRPGRNEAIMAAAVALIAASPAEAQRRPSVAPPAMQAIAPGLASYTDDVLFGDVWVRPQLDPRDRSLVTLSVLIATGKTAQLAGHLKRGLDNGVTPLEIAGLTTQLAFYTGWPNAVSALETELAVFKECNLDMAGLGAAGRHAAPPVASGGPTSSATGTIAPKLTELTGAVVERDLWRRTDLTPRDRSLVTIAALAADGDQEALPAQLRRGLANGLTRAQIGEALTHLAFYAGWPKAMAAVAAAASFTQGGQQTMTSGIEVVTPGREPTAGPAEHFTGAVEVTSSFKGTGSAGIGGATVTFQPGAHTNWHTHPLGQLLIVTAGHGWVQSEGEQARAINPGDAVWIGPNVKHWHGATRTSAMTHVAVAEAKDGKTVAWLEPVADADYQGPK